MNSSVMKLFLTVLLISFPKLFLAQDVSLCIGLNLPFSLEFKYNSSKHDWSAHNIGKSSYDKALDKIDLSEFMESIKFLVNF